MTIIGIDLGTTNCCAAAVGSNGDVELITHSGGDYTMPSFFATNDAGDELVGREAKRQAQLNPRRTVHGIKRLMGLPYNHKVVQRMVGESTYSLEVGARGEPEADLDGKRFTAIDVSSRFLARIRDLASKALGEKISQAVVTVPAYYNDRQRQAVHAAGQAVGLEILRVLNEPTAAALAYGVRRQGTERIAVYDLGGGTFDISVIEASGTKFRVLATGGDLHLGGLDFDQAIVNYLLAEFEVGERVDLSSDPIARQRIKEAAENSKIDLSSRSEVAINLPFIGMNDLAQPLNLENSLTRENMEKLVAPLVERTFDTCLRVCQDAGVEPKSIDQVILVGGQTRMPLIQERIRQFFGRDPSKMVHPDEAVAVGAALYAASLGNDSALPITLQDVLPMSIAIEGAAGTLHTIFDRNASIPNSKTIQFTTHEDNQADLVMRLYQGDSTAAADNTLLGEFTFSGIRQGVAGSVRVEVHFDVNDEGILVLKAKDLDSGAVMEQRVAFQGR